MRFNAAVNWLLVVVGIHGAAECLWVLYCTCFVWLRRRYGGFAGALRRWTFRLRYVFLFATFGSGLALSVMDGDISALRWVDAVTFVAGWVICNIDDYDDDFWKRQRGKVSAVVRSIGHRLTLVPG